MHEVEEGVYCGGPSGACAGGTGSSVGTGTGAVFPGLTSRRRCCLRRRRREGAVEVGFDEHPLHRQAQGCGFVDAPSYWSSVAPNVPMLYGEVASDADDARLSRLDGRPPDLVGVIAEEECAAAPLASRVREGARRLREWREAEEAPRRAGWSGPVMCEGVVAGGGRGRLRVRVPGEVRVALG